jgi:tRNA pseudouridine55 synthase
MSENAGEPNGWVILDKDQNITSNTALTKVKRLLKSKKAGHAGTLDPLATGVLPMAFGEATKTMPWVADTDKTYVFEVKWGEQTNTDDSEGEVVAQSQTLPEAAQLEALIPVFSGIITQRPPQFSALKIDGQRAYDLARRGLDVELNERQVTVHDLKLLQHQGRTSTWEVTCTKGTYVRAIARDMGLKGGWLGHITALRRTRVGPFTLADAKTLAQIEDFVHKEPSEGKSAFMLPVMTALDDIPAVAVSKADAARLKSGQSVLMRGPDALLYEGPVSVQVNGVLLALAQMAQGAIHPRRLFHLGA